MRDGGSAGGREPAADALEDLGTVPRALQVSSAAPP